MPTFPTPDIETPPSFHCHRLVLRSELEPALFGALALLLTEDNWVLDGTMTVEEAVQECQDMWTRIEESCDRMIGEVLMHTVKNGMLPTYLLECDGTQYARVDYPELYDRLRTPYIVDADNFVVPDMRGRVPIGRGTDGTMPNAGVNERGGSWEHTLIRDQMPQHRHTTTVATIGVSAEGAGVPIPASTLPHVPEFTGQTGGSNPHPNAQPFTGIIFAIIANNNPE